MPDSITALYQAFAGQLAASIRRSFGNGPPDPEDVAQQSFQKLIERGDLESIDNPRGFLWRIARNLVLGEKRAQEVRTRHDYRIEQLYFPLRDDTSDPQRISLAREQLKVINEVLRQMPEKRRRAVVLHRIDGLTVADVGRRLGISRQNAAKHLARGVADINVALLAKSLLNEPSPGDPSTSNTAPASTSSQWGGPSS
ncbi:MAG: sigma-70 family RNA polymerase sigma factor [Pseudomonadota bacterium]